MYQFIEVKYQKAPKWGFFYANAEKMVVDAEYELPQKCPY